jgi:hypothetical protein
MEVNIQMAAEDLENMPAPTNKQVRTAGDNILSFDTEGAVDLETVNRALAADAGVKDAAFIDYDVALETHANRDDIEDLAHKNARDMPADFAQAAFMRRTDTSQWDNELANTDANGPTNPDYTLGENAGVYEQVGGDVDSNATPGDDTADANPA